MRSELSVILFVTLVVSLLTMSHCGSVYNVNFNCGPCATVSGCSNNLCFKMSGDLTTEVCLGSSTCMFSGSQSVKIARCSFDMSGACSSGLCVQMANVDMCMAIPGGYCLNGVTAYVTCSNSILTTTLSGGVYSTPTTTTFDMHAYMPQCYFSSATQFWSTCSGDIYGGTCNCCVQASFTGVSTFLGTCVPESSDIYRVKSSVPASNQMFLKFLGLFLLFLSALTL